METAGAFCQRGGRWNRLNSSLNLSSSDLGYWNRLAAIRILLPIREATCFEPLCRGFWRDSQKTEADGL